MIYLDHAATSRPKPACVVDAVAAWYRDIGVSASRGDGVLCRRAAAAEAEARARMATLLGCEPRRTLFTSGATEALNLFLASLLGPGDTAVTTAQEHSSVARPLRHLQRQRDVRVEVAAVDRHGFVDLDDLARRIGRGCRVLVLNHAGNVTGAVQDVAAAAALARARGATVLLDASQSAGLLPLAGLDVDAIALSAHKSLLGPPGLGVLALRRDAALQPLKRGGTGSSRALDEQPTEWPTAFESGTPNGPAIAGLAAALGWIEQQTGAGLLAHGLAVVDALTTALRSGLGDRLRLHSPPPGAPRVPVLSCTIAGLDPAEVGILLDAADIHVRTGFHCAPWIHRYLGTESGGTVRLSPGPFVSADAAPLVARALAG